MFLMNNDQEYVNKRLQHSHIAELFIRSRLIVSVLGVITLGLKCCQMCAQLISCEQFPHSPDEIIFPPLSCLHCPCLPGLVSPFCNKSGGEANT